MITLVIKVDIIVKWVYNCSKTMNKESFMKNINFLLICILSIVFLFVSCGFNGNNELDKDPARTSETIMPHDEKIYWNGSIDDPFDDSTVILVMDRNFSGINKVHEKSFFGNIGIESIEDLMYITNPDIVANINLEEWRQILRLTLTVKSKENVVKAIRHLEKIVGIMNVEPNHISEPAHN